MKPKHWLVFILLCTIRSSSFMWIKIAVQGAGPITLVGATLIIASLMAANWQPARAIVNES